MTMTAEQRAQLREEVSNPANGSKDHLRKLTLALLDELERKDKRIAKLEATEQHSQRGWKEAHEQECRAEAAEKRIAELEARTVTVKLPDVERWRSVDAVRAQNAYRVLVIKTLADAGINLTVEG